MKGRIQKKGNSNRKERLKDKGITLIALVVTIIILLILAGVTIASVTGDNGLFRKAQDTKEETRASVVEEEKEFWKTTKVMSEYGNTEEEKLEDVLDKLVAQGNLTDKEKQDIKTTGKVTIGSKTIVFLEDDELVKGPEKMEPTAIYAKLYSDNTMIFSSFDYTATDHGDVRETYREEELCEGDYTMEPPPWMTEPSSNGISHARAEDVIIYDKIAPTRTNYWFYEIESITGIENLITNNVTNMDGMFTCSRLESLDLRNFDTSNVTSMNRMFAGCRDCSLVLSNFNTTNVKSMMGMFSSMQSHNGITDANWETLDLSSLSISEDTNISGMFDGCNQLTNVYVKNEEIATLMQSIVPEGKTISFIVK